MKQTPIVFRVDQGEHHPVFSLKQITVADDSNFLQRFIDIADKAGDEKAEAVYQIKAEMLAEWAEPFPNNLTHEVPLTDEELAARKEGDTKTKKKEKIKRPDEALDNADAIKAFFAEADVDKDWISETAINTLRMRHSPTVSFF